MWVIRAILIALVIVCLVAFAFYNIDQTNVVDVNLIYITFTNVPMLTIVLFSFVAGVLVSLLLFISVYIKLTMQLRNVNKKVKGLEGEVTVLRNRPIEESAELIANSTREKSGVKSPFDN